MQYSFADRLPSSSRIVSSNSCAEVTRAGQQVHSPTQNLGGWQDRVGSGRARAAAAGLSSMRKSGVVVPPRDTQSIQAR
jgi:hypothetical protein